ncbi:hypothetical protein FQN54_006765 [Arachnomyces sp. PD_36]|nr:hypothetical protein FQN54_006765 [Arachnomyces sp. PD_36]
MTEATLESLKTTIVEKVDALSHQLGAEGIPQPTLGEAGHASYKGESTALRKSRYDLARAAKSLLLLAQGPEDTSLSLMWSAIDAANMDILVRFNFFSAIPADSSSGISADDLAAKVDLPVDLTERVIRFAIGNGIFAEPTPSIFVHSAASSLLSHSPELRAVGRMAAGPLTQMVVRTADALELQQAGRNGITKTVLDGQSQLGPEDPAFCLAFPGYKNPFHMGDGNKAFAEIGHAFMRDQGSTSMMKIDHLLKARDWSDCAQARIIDVGGSVGHASIALAGILPNATFVVLDSSVTGLDQGREVVAKQFPQLVDRISFEVHDFFTPMPADKAGDVFLFQWILHDWSDDDAVKILKALVPGLKPGARVLIAEAVRQAPPAGLANTLDEKMVMFQDMTMLAAHNARERNVAEFVRVFGEADGRFHHVATGGGVDGAYRSLLEFEFRA